MAVTADNSAPYTPTRQILEIVQRFRERGNPRPITSDALARIGIPDSLNARTLQSLKVLDLIDESGEPTKTFEGIRLASSDGYKKALQEWIQAAYADVFAIVDPATDDDSRVRDAFRNYNPTGQQGRMVTLFLGLCEEAGIRHKPEKKKEPSSSASRNKPVVRQRKQRQDKGPQMRQDQNLPGVPPALSGLLNSLPSPSTGWTQSDRDRFFVTFGTVLDFCYPIRLESEISGDGDGAVGDDD